MGAVGGGHGPGTLTEHGPGRDGLSVQPEGHLGQDHRHDAGQVGLDDEVAYLPLQVEVGGHDGVLACGRRATAGQRRPPRPRPPIATAPRTRIYWADWRGGGGGRGGARVS